MRDRIEKSIELKAPVERVWRAISDYEEFGEWFRVELEGPFVLGEVTRGRITVPGYEHVIWKTTTTAIEPEQLLAFTWCPAGDEPYADCTDEVQMLVEFTLEPTDEGTRLTISESGFASLPDDSRRQEMFHRNESGWNEQARNIAAHVES